MDLYTQADQNAVRAEVKKRLLITWLPVALLFAAVVAVFILCQIHRQDWGWIFASCCTIAIFAYGLFMDGVYLRPMLAYQEHVRNMLEGRQQETTGLVQFVADEVTDKGGLDAYVITLNVGDRNDPEDERLLYWDVQQGKPDFPVGTRVKVRSKDKMIFDMQRA